MVPSGDLSRSDRIDLAMAAPVLFTSMLDVDHHDTGAWHPERSSRLPAVQVAIADPAVHEVIEMAEPRQATIDDLALAHDASYLAGLEQFITSGRGELDPDTQTSIGSWETARWAAGSGLAAIDALDRGEADAAFVAIRPPGHHATATQAMGFCLINNVAVAARALTARGQRVAILDWDVHHGNGTQDIFWDDDRVLYASIHESPAYPGTGRASEVGASGAAGLTVNVPLPAGATGDHSLAAFDTIIGPAIEAFAPDWILVSAGYDAHRADPLAGLAWTAGDYGLLATRVRSLAPASGRTVFLLEGGYDLEALTSSVTATIAAVAGVDHETEAPSSGGPGRDDVIIAARFRARALES